MNIPQLTLFLRNSKELIYLNLSNANLNELLINYIFASYYDDIY